MTLCVGEFLQCVAVRVDVEFGKKIFRILKSKEVPALLQLSHNCK